MAVVKVLITEVDGVELEEAYREHLLLAEEVPFDNSTNGFTSTDTQSAIEEAAGSGPSDDVRFVQVVCTPGACVQYKQINFLVNNELNFLISGVC